MKHNKLAVLVMGAMLLLGSSGCMSYMAKQNWNDAQEAKAVRIEANGEQVLMGVDVGALPYLKDNWPIALGAGALDAGMAYGTYLLVDELTSSGGDDDKGDQNGNQAGNDSINIKGDHNTVNTGDTITTPPAEEAPVEE